MKSVKIKLKKDEMVFHQQSVFQEGDEMVIFSLDEFLKFQLELKKCLEHVLTIAEDCSSQKSKNVPSTDALRMLNWIKKMEEEINKMDKTDIQKNLWSFK